MFITLAVVIGVGAALMIYRGRAGGRAEQDSLGRMSGEWLAEHGASTRY